MNNAEFTKTLIAGADVPARTLVKFGADEKHVIAAAAATDLIVGVTCDLDTKSGEPCDVQLCCGIPLVKSGAAIAAGKFVTSDASGNAVEAADKNRVAGIALQAAGGAGELIDVLLAPGTASL